MVCWVPDEGAGAEPPCYCRSAVAEETVLYSACSCSAVGKPPCWCPVPLLLRLAVALLESVSVQQCSTDRTIGESFFWDLFFFCCMAQDSVAI